VALEEELQPQSVVELICVFEVARHAAAIDVAAGAEAAALRAGNPVSELISSLSAEASADAADDQRVIGAICNDAVE
jgi:hypothetical protein